MDPYPIGELATDSVTGFHGKITAITHQMGRGTSYTIEAEASNQPDGCGCVRSFAASRTLLILPSAEEDGAPASVPVDEAIKKRASTN